MLYINNNNDIRTAVNFRFDLGKPLKIIVESECGNATVQGREHSRLKRPIKKFADFSTDLGRIYGTIKSSMQVWGPVSTYLGLR